MVKKPCVEYPNGVPLLGKLICYFFGHRHYVETWNGGYVSEKCVRCWDGKE